MDSQPRGEEARGGAAPDHATSELVQYSTYTTYGTAESDYRPARWRSFREPYRFTGKEEDIEVGLNYHGARYYSPALRRWMSPDPVTIHSGGSDINPYSYGKSNPTSYIDPDGRDIVLVTVAVIAIAAAVSATTNAVVQYETTGHVNWGWKGVAGAAVAGGVGAAVGMGVGGLATGALGTYGAAALGGAAGGATAGGLGTGLAGGSWNDVGKGALTGAVAGAIGGAVGVYAGTTSSNALTAFGGTMAGTGAGTASGIGWSAAAYGDMPTWQSAGIAFASAFGGAIAGTALGNGVQATADHETYGEAAGVASGKAANASSGIKARSAATSNGGNPVCSRDRVFLSEPIADAQVKDEIWRTYNRSDLGSMRAHEEGIVSRGNRVGGQLVMDRIIRADPSITLAQARQLRETPVLARMPTIPDSPHADVYWDAHSHPFPEGTYLYTSSEGRRIYAGAGASGADAYANVALTATGRNAYSYIAAPEGIYRVYQGRCNWIAPITYIQPGN